MASKVWVYPERTYEQLGAVRWVVDWEELRPSARDKDEIDYDSDILHRRDGYLTKEMAMEAAHRIVNAGITYYGAATVTKQVVDWFVKEDKVAEWRDSSDREEVSA